jgi:lysylphosphatidylglycerol synthetase-like protein (DUF2156 family)
MAAANQALAAIGGDVSFTVSYAVASELRASATTSGMAESELIAVVLLIAVLLAAIPPATARGQRVLQQLWVARRPCFVRAGPAARAWGYVESVFDWVLNVPPKIHKRDDAATDAPTEGSADHADGPHARNIFAFLSLLLATAQRIAVSLLVQSVAATAVAAQSLRADRLITLMACAVFFIFLQSGATAVNAPR